MQNWFSKLLRCPYEGSELSADRENSLSCSKGHSFPVVDGIPVLLSTVLPDTLWVLSASLKLSNDWVNGNRRDPYFIETLGLTPEQRSELKQRVSRSNESDVDPVISFLVSATSGYLYEDLVGSLTEAPIPSIRIPKGNGVLLDVGCNWGRWSIAAAKKGYKTIGIDPSIGALLAAKRLSKRLGLDCSFICGDARTLPIQEETIDKVFSYSVIQHFSKDDAALALGQIKLALKSGGTSLIQMPNANGLRSAFHIYKQRKQGPTGFDVRYWVPNELKHKFSDLIGPSQITVDGFFGLGIQPSDWALLSMKARVVILASETMRFITYLFPFLLTFSDSLYVVSSKIPEKKS